MDPAIVFSYTNLLYIVTKKKKVSRSWRYIFICILNLKRETFKLNLCLYIFIYILVKEYFSFLTKASLKRLSNIYFKFGKNIFTQVAGIRMGCDPDPFLFTNLYFGSEKLRERIWYVLDGLPMYFVSSMI